MIEVLVVGCGRDGTQSLTHILRDLFAANGREADVRHESDSVELYAGLPDYIRRGDDRRLRAVMSAWRHDVEVSNGFAFCMPVVHAVFGGALKVVHLRRARAAHVASLVRRPRVTPEDFGGYIDFDYRGPFRHVRPTAVDYGEMSREEWEALSLAERFGWYHDKSHALVAAHLSLFEATMELRTEELNDPAALDRLRAFVDPGLERAPRPVHVHAAGLVDYAARDPQELRVMEKMFHKFDVNAALADELYPLRYFARYAMHHAGADPERYAAALRALREEIDAFLAGRRRG